MGDKRYYMSSLVYLVLSYHQHAQGKKQTSIAKDYDGDEDSDNNLRKQQIKRVKRSKNNDNNKTEWKKLLKKCAKCQKAKVKTNMVISTYCPLLKMRKYLAAINGNIIRTLKVTLITILVILIGFCERYQ